MVALLFPALLWAETNAVPGLERLNAIQEKLASVRTVQAEFEQEKNLSLFQQKIMITGRIYIENSGRFAWHADTPVRYRLSVNGDDVRQWDEDTRQVQRLPVSSNPVLKMAMGQMRDWFVGRYTELLKEYDVTVLDASPLMLRFVPKPAVPMARVIRSVEVTLQSDGQYIEGIRIEDLNGDATTIRFKNPVLNAAIDPRAWEVAPRE
jgi:outer membrane lipoprotein-sorting protein